MKKLLLILILSFSQILFSQCNCAKSFSGHINDHILNIEEISDGFLYSFYNGSSNDFPVTGQYILKYDFDCNLIWKKPIQHLTFTVDPAGNIYTVEQQGYYQNYKGFLRKYSSDGILVWEKMFSNARILNNISKHLFYYDSNIYLTSNFFYGVNFEDQVIFQYPYPWISGTRAKFFIAKYTTEGSFVDAKIYGDGIKDYFQDSEMDDLGNIYFVQSDANFTASKIVKINSNLETIKSEVIATKTSETNSWGYVPTVLHYNRFNSKFYSYGVYYKSTNLGTHVISNSSSSQQGLIVEYNSDFTISKYLKYNNNSPLQIPNDEGNNNPYVLNRSFFNENTSNEIYVFSHFQDKVNLGGTDIYSSQNQYGNPNIDLIYFKINLDTFTPQFIFKSNSTDIHGGANAPSKFLLINDRAYLTGNYHQKKMEINGIKFLNNSGNGDSDAFLFRFDGDSNIGSLQSNSPVCLQSSIYLKASGGTNYSWTGPNGFSSTQQNPTIPNATVLNSGNYSCIISGTGGCDGTFTVEVKVEDKTSPIPTVANLPAITGNCKTIITTIPTATDNCAGNITGTTSDPLQYSLPGNYIIHWKYDDVNGNISTQNQNLTIVSEPLPAGNASQNFCQINNPKISDIQISGTSIKWYDASGNLLNANTLLVNGTKYFATQTLNGCESAKTEIIVNLNNPNTPTGNASQTFCGAQLPKISDIMVTGQNIKWFDAAGTILATTTPLTDGKTYFASQTVNGCESTQKLAVTVSVKNGGIPANDYAIAICNPTTGNTKIENLNDYKANLVANPGIYIFEFFDANNQVISDISNVTLNLGANIFNVKISNNLACFDFVKLTLTLDPKPKLDLPESVEFCNGQSATLDAGGNGLIAYEWTRTDDPKVISNNQILVVSMPGNYILKVENSFGCQNSTIVKVTQSILAKIIGVQIVNNTATILLSEPGNFEFSLDQISWQDSNIFSNLKNGNYTVHVRTKSGCIIGSENFSIFNVSNVFTPDADGKNDTWKISGLENYPGSEIKIFDRFGKAVLDKISTSTFEWDGTFNSRKLPTGNYWYVIKVTDGRLLQGWLLLKNRN